MTVTIRTRKQIAPHKVEDTYTQEVGEFAFQSGSLFYFKKNDFEYNVLSYDKKEDCYYR